MTVLRVSDGSVAQSTGLRPGDVIASAAGSALNSPAELVGIIARQPWGTWLPLEVVRDGKRLALVARYKSTGRAPPKKGQGKRSKK